MDEGKKQTANEIQFVALRELQRCNKPSTATDHDNDNDNRQPTTNNDNCNLTNVIKNFTMLL